MNEDEKLKPSHGQVTAAGTAAPPNPEPDKKDAPPSGPQPQATVMNGADVHAYIGRQLRAVFDDVAKQPIPERFLDLMRQLDECTAEP